LLPRKWPEHVEPIDLADMGSLCSSDGVRGEYIIEPVSEPLKLLSSAQGLFSLATLPARAMPNWSDRPPLSMKSGSGVFSGSGPAGVPSGNSGTELTLIMGGLT